MGSNGSLFPLVNSLEWTLFLLAAELSSANLAKSSRLVALLLCFVPVLLL